MAEAGSEVGRAGGPVGEPLTFELGLDRIDRDGIHVEEPDKLPLDEQYVDLEHVARYGSLEDLIDGFVEAYNAHDLEGVTDLLAPDAELPGLGHDLAGFPSAIERLWDERPNAVLTRGRLEERPVAVLWDVGEGGAWVRVALLDFDGSDDDGQLELVELIDDAVTVEQAQADAPEPDLVEGARWEEWYEGDDS